MGEAADLSPAQCQFESDRGYMNTVKWRDWSFIPRWYKTKGLVDVLQVVSTPFGGIAINKIKKEDPSFLYHDHPWNFVSFILRGHYSERLWSNWQEFDNSEVKRRGRFSLHRISHKTAHQIYECEPNTYTVMFYGKWQRDGFRFYAGGQKADLSKFIKSLPKGANMFPIRGRDHKS